MSEKKMRSSQTDKQAEISNLTGPCITIHFPDFPVPIALPAKKVVETAFNALKSSSTEPGFYRKQCWDVLKCYLLASLQGCYSVML